MEVCCKKKILLVEDEMILGMATKSNLEKLGYTVQLATKSEQALDFTRVDQKIDMVLMDIDLGKGINGIETCKLIVKEKDIPIVFVSSHTEKSIVSLTEEITSYGYIVKSSHVTVYDASMKMAFKLYEEKTKRENFSKYLEVALENASEAIFITDNDGEIVFFNKAYLRIQGLSDSESHLVEKKYADYSEQIIVFSETGDLLEPSGWASSRGLAGYSGKDKILIVYHKGIQSMLVNKYTYAPIYNVQGKIIGAYVKIENTDHALVRDVMEKIIKEFKLTIIST